MWLASLPTALADCPELSAPAAFRSSVDAAWDVGVSGDAAAFRAEMASLQGRLACLDAPLSPADAAAFHRNRALVSSGAGDGDGARAAAGAALRLAPDQREAWSAASAAFASLASEATPPGAEVEFSVSLAATVLVDGAPASARPVEHPVVVQVFGMDGRPLGGAWVDPRSPLPEWVTFPEPSCPAALPVARLVASVGEAEAAFARLDTEGFRAGLRAVAGGLPCVDGVLGPREAAAIHRLEGMRLFALGAELGALRSLQESRTLDPITRPPPEVMPPESSLEALWTSAGTLAGPPWVPAADPGPLVLRVDGIATALRPATLPTIVQATTPNGRVLWTRYVPALARMPDLAPYAARAEAEGSLVPPALAIYRQDDARRRTSVRDRVLGLSGAGLMVGSGLLYTVNATARADFYDRHTPPERLGALAQLANTSAVASIAVGSLGAGLVAAAVVLP